MKFLHLATAISVLCVSLFKDFASCSELSENVIPSQVPVIEQNQLALQPENQKQLEIATRDYLRICHFRFRGLPKELQDSISRIVANWNPDIKSLNPIEMTFFVKLGSSQFLGKFGRDLRTCLLVFIASAYELIKASFIDKKPCKELFVFFLASFFQFKLLIIRAGAEGVARVIRDLLHVEISDKDLNLLSFSIFFLILGFINFFNRSHFH